VENLQFLHSSTFEYFQATALMQVESRQYLIGHLLQVGNPTGYKWRFPTHTHNTPDSREPLGSWFTKYHYCRGNRSVDP
jgi:hypothetical protein